MLQICLFIGLLNHPQNEFDYWTHQLITSPCHVADQAINTWRAPPDWNLIDQRLQTIREAYALSGKSPPEFSIFFPEVVSLEWRYKDFNFARMCRPETIGRWGPNTCIPDLRQLEYRRYLVDLGQCAIDRGINRILWGQIYLQDPEWWRGNSGAVIVNRLLREYASPGSLTIGVQSNHIRSEWYLQHFDYIHGGMLLDEELYKGPCHPHEYRFCYALSYNPEYTSLLPVVMSYDFGGTPSPLAQLAALPIHQRIAMVSRHWSALTDRGIPFAMPYLVPSVEGERELELYKVLLAALSTGS